MRVLVELGRLLLADALRGAGRAAAAIADRLGDGAERATFAEADEGDLLTDEAAAMLAAREPPQEAEPKPPPPAGSLEERGRKVGQRWAQ